MRKFKCKKINPTLLQGAGLYIAKLQRPVFDKDAESKDEKINLITITSEKQLHNDRKK